MKKRKILLFNSNPNDTRRDRLHLDRQDRAIQEALQKGGRKELFEYESKWSVRVKDIVRGLADAENAGLSTIVHFSGHGGRNGEFYAENDLGESKRLDSIQIKRILSERPYLECAIFTACYSDDLADLISQEIEHVIAMNDEVQDDSAIHFSETFYELLSLTGDIQRAFFEARNRVCGESYKETNIPVLYINGQLKREFERMVKKGHPAPSLSIPSIPEISFRLGKLIEEKLNKDFFGKKYNKETYWERMDAKKQYEQFLAQDEKHCFVVSGKAGKGKTSFLCDAYSKSNYKTNNLQVLIDSTEISDLKKFTLYHHLLKDIIDLSLENILAQRMFFELLKTLKASESEELIVFLDGINELEGDSIFSDFNNQMDELIQKVAKDSLPIKFVISCRIDFWQEFDQSYWVKEQLFNSIKNKPSVELGNFDLHKDIPEVIKKYFEWYRIKGEVIGTARKQCCDPLLLRYLCEAYTNRPINSKAPPQTIKESYIQEPFYILRKKHVFDLFVNNIRQRIFERVEGRRKVNKSTVEEYTTNYLLHIAEHMYSKKRNYIKTHEVYEIAKQIDHPDKNHLNPEKFLTKDTIFFTFVDEGLILEEHPDFTVESFIDKRFKFVFETYFEYTIGRYIAKVRWAGKWNSYTELTNKIEEISKDFKKLLNEHEEAISKYNFTNIFGAIQFALWVTEDEKLFLNDSKNLFIELIRVMLTDKNSQLIHKQKAFDTIRGSRLCLLDNAKNNGYSGTDHYQLHDELYNVFYELAGKTDFVIAWDLENTIRALANKNPSIALDNMVHWAKEEGVVVRQMFAVQVFSRLFISAFEKVIHPVPSSEITSPERIESSVQENLKLVKKILQIFKELLKRKDYQKNFWLSRPIIFSFQKFGLEGASTDEYREQVNETRSIIQSFVENTQVYKFSRSLGISILPALSGSSLPKLNSLESTVFSTKDLWGIWSLIFELKKVNFGKDPILKNWINQFIGKIIKEFGNPHLDYAIARFYQEQYFLNPHLDREGWGENNLQKIKQRKWHHLSSPYFSSNQGLSVKNSNKTAIAYSPIYLEPSYDNHLECRERLQAILNKLHEVGEHNFIWIDPIQASEEEHIKLVHDHVDENDRHRDDALWDNYLEDVKKGSEIVKKGEARNHQLSGPAELRYESFEVALTSAGGVISSVDYLCNEKNGASAAWSLGRPPGHLANNQICIFNNIAIGVRWAMDRYNIKKIIIIDCDAHHGKHTDRTFRKDDHVIYFSMHIDSGYSKESGRVTNTGEQDSKGEGYNFNIPYPLNLPDEGYIYIIQKLLIPLCLEFKPEMIFLSTGFDGHFEDSLNPGCKLSEKAFIALAEAISEVSKRLNAKVVGAFEGGYGLDSLASSFVHMMNIIGDWGVPAKDIGFVDGAESIESDPKSIDKVKDTVKERVKLMLETKEKNKSYELYQDESYWESLLSV